MSDPRRQRDDDLLDDLGRALMGPDLPDDPTRTPTPERVAEIRAAAVQMLDEPAAPASLGQRRGSGRRLLLAGGIAAGVGGVAGYLVSNATAAAPAADGPVVEPITFSGPAGISTTAGLIDHTWGAELVLDVEGLQDAVTYDVVYRTADAAVAAGSLRGVADRLMRCRFNAATLRADVRAVELRQGDRAVLRADTAL